MLLVNVEMKCVECEKHSNIDEDYNNLICDDCNDKRYAEIAKEIYEIIMEDVERSKVNELDGDSIVGFNSEIEKKSYLRGLKRGVENVLQEIAMAYDEHGFGHGMWEIYEKMKESWPKQIINSELLDYDKDRICENCDGKGRIELESK